MKIRPLEPSDWMAVQAIYADGVASGDATFETRIPSWEEWDAARLPACRLVAEDAPGPVGFAALSPASKRPVYAGVGEVMVYVAERARGQGVGGMLMAALVRASEEAGLWTLQASIFPENEASIRAHERVGFRVMGYRERIARFHDGRWRNTVLMERRSETVGLA